MSSKIADILIIRNNLIQKPLWYMTAFDEYNFFIVLHGFSRLNWTLKVLVFNLLARQEGNPNYFPAFFIDYWL